MTIDVTPGSGATVAAESLGSAQYQQIKVIDGKVGSSSVLSFVNNGTAIPVSIMGTVSVVGTLTANQGGNAGLASAWPVKITNGSQTATVNASSMLSVSVDNSIVVGSVIGAITPYAQPNSFVSAVTSVITTTASVVTLQAPSATLRNHITHILATNGGTVGTYINLVDGGQVIYAGYAAGSGGGFSATLPVPLRQPTSGLGLFVGTTATTSVVVAITGYIA